MVAVCIICSNGWKKNPPLRLSHDTSKQSAKRSDGGGEVITWLLFPLQIMDRHRKYSKTESRDAKKIKIIKKGIFVNMKIRIMQKNNHPCTTSNLVAKG